MSVPPVWLGTAVLVIATAALVDAARRTAVRLLPGEALAQAAATAVLTAAGMVGILELLGLVGLLEGWAVLLVTLALWAAARLALGPSPWPAPRLPATLGLPSAPEARLALLAAGALAVPLTAQLLSSLQQPYPTFDALSGHLHSIVDWIQAGNTRILPYASPVAAEPRYPADSELTGLWFTLPLHRDMLVQAPNLLWAALMLLGAGLAARELGARLSGAAVAALAGPSVPFILFDLVGTNMTDLLLCGGLASCLGFLVLARRVPGPAPLLLAGLSAGLAAGSRYAGLIALAPVAVVAAVQTATRAPRPSRRSVLRGAAIAGAAMVATGAYFYVRNWVITGDPVYPQSVPWHHVDSVELDPFKLFSSYAQLGVDPHAWRILLGELWARGGVLTTALVLAVAVPPVLALTRRERSPLAWCWALLPAAELLAFLATPLSAGYLIDGQPVGAGADLNLRYVLPTVLTSAIVLAAEMGRLRPGVADLAAAGGCGLGLLGLAVASPVVPQQPSPTYIAAAVVGLAAVAAAVVSGLVDRRALGVLAACGAAGAVALSPAVATHWEKGRAGLPFDPVEALLPQGATVDVAGFCESYALFGAQLDRRVLYLTGADDRVSRPLATTYQDWLDALHRSGVTLVVVGHDVCYPQDDQATWIAAHPESFRMVGSRGGASVWQVTT